ARGWVSSSLRESGTSPPSGGSSPRTCSTPAWVRASSAAPFACTATCPGTRPRRSSLRHRAIREATIPADSLWLLEVGFARRGEAPLPELPRQKAERDDRQLRGDERRERPE